MLGVLDHHDGIRTARHGTAGDRRRSPQHRPPGSRATGIRIFRIMNHVACRPPPDRRRNRKTVDIGAIEWRQRRSALSHLGQRISECVGEFMMLALHCPRNSAASKRAIALPGGDCQKLALIDGAVSGRLCGLRVAHCEVCIIFDRCTTGTRKSSDPSGTVSQARPEFAAKARPRPADPGAVPAPSSTILGGDAEQPGASGTKRLARQSAGQAIGVEVRSTTRPSRDPAHSAAPRRASADTPAAVRPGCRRSCTSTPPCPASASTGLVAAADTTAAGRSGDRKAGIEHGDDRCRIARGCARTHSAPA